MRFYYNPKPNKYQIITMIIILVIGLCVIAGTIAVICMIVNSDMPTWLKVLLLKFMNN